MVFSRLALENSGAKWFSDLGPGSNTTTRDRQVEHTVRKILCFCSDFPLTEFSHLITLRRQIRGIAIRRPQGAPSLQGTATSFDVTCRVSSETSRRRPSTPRRRRSQRCRRGVTQILGRVSGFGDALEGVFSFGAHEVPAFQPSRVAAC